MGEEEGVYTEKHDYGNGVENYECEGCRMDTTFSSFHCGVCPHNDDRIREYNRKYVR